MQDPPQTPLYTFTPGQTEGVKWTSWVTILCSLQSSLKAQEAAWLSLAARLAEVLPPLHFNKATQEDLNRKQGGCKEGQHIQDCEHLGASAKA